MFASIIDIMDEFGSVFDNVGFIEILLCFESFRAKRMPTHGDISDGWIRVGEIRYDLPRLDFKCGSCAVAFVQQDGTSVVYAREMRIEVDAEKYDDMVRRYTARVKK
jgi:hypothetical protein